MTTAFSFAYFINPIQELSYALTSRQVYLRIVIYPRSDIFFYIASIIIVRHISGGCTLLYTLRTRLTLSTFAMQGRDVFTLYPFTP